MKAKAVSVSIFAVVVIAAAGIVSVATKSEILTPAAIITPAPAPEGVTAIRTNSFDLALPAGWEISSQDDVLPVVAANSKEEFVNEKVREVNFKTNLSINGTKLGDYSLRDYVRIVKDSLIDNLAVMNIVKEGDFTASDNEAYFMEVESTQQGLEFGTLIVFIVDKDNFVWAFSFNSLRSSWEEYKKVFYRTIEGIDFK